MVTDNWGNILSMRLTISIGLQPAAKRTLIFQLKFGRPENGPFGIDQMVLSMIDAPM
jgi:hypothetical protein